MFRFFRSLVLIVLFFAAAAPVLAQPVAQNPEYRLDLQRNFGYGAGSDIRGDFTNRIYGPIENIQSVTYRIDGEEMATVSEPPYSFKYNTSSYPPGWHELVAIVTTRDGRQVTTPVVRANFLSAEQQADGMQRILIPVLGGILLATLIGVGVQFLAMRRNPAARQPGAPRSYGASGGTICPRCGRAYPRHFFAPNLGLWKLDRCDFCGKVALVQRKSPAELAAAEQAERDALGSENSLPGAGQGDSEEERLRKLMDESRYSE